MEAKYESYNRGGEYEPTPSMNLISTYDTTTRTHTEIWRLMSWGAIKTHCESQYHRVVWFVDNQMDIPSEIISDEKNDIYHVQSGEVLKSEHSWQDYMQKIHSLGLDHQSILIAVGGGSISDFVGFVASTYKRGIAWGNIPTTLLGIVDAGIGGKTAINFNGIKNQIGTIYQPRFIGYMPSLFDTLPREVVAQGFAEILKYALIYDYIFYTYLCEKDIEEFYQSTEVRNYIIEKCIGYKSTTVEHDSLDKSSRKILNFGHTVGHALEAEYKLAHGYAVALGIIISLHISYLELGLHREVIQDTKNLLQRYLLPTQFEFDPERIYNITCMDKKRIGDTVDFILISQIGEAVIYPLAIDRLRDYIYQAKEEHWI